jgi:hypothetical protein
VGDQNFDGRQTPKGEVEILPPEDRSGPWGGAIYTSRGLGKVKVVRLGPVGSALLGLGLLAMMTLGFLFLGGALLLLLPIAGLLALGAVVSGLIANPFKRLR